MTALRSGNFFILAISAFTFLMLSCHFSALGGVSGNPVENCVDKRHNFIVANSDPKEKHDVVIEKLTGVVYNADGRPACHNGRPTVLMPGIAKLLHGKLKVPRKYDLAKSGIFRMTVTSPNFDDPLCLRGVSQYVAMPSKFCSFPVCEFIGDDLCAILEQPGVHTIHELEEKLRFNATFMLPEPPSLFGISLLDLFSGEFSFIFGIDYEGATIMELRIPSNERYLQIGLAESDYADDKTNDEDDHHIFDYQVDQLAIHHHRHENLTKDEKIQNQTIESHGKNT